MNMILGNMPSACWRSSTTTKIEPGGAFIFSSGVFFGSSGDLVSLAGGSPPLGPGLPSGLPKSWPSPMPANATTDTKHAASRDDLDIRVPPERDGELRTQ